MSQSNLAVRPGYKASSPLATIQKIRNILYQSNIFVIEDYWTKVSNGIFSVTLKVPGTACKTHGKSFNEIYALASAYGEFIERLQNMVLFGKNYLGNQKDKTPKPPDCIQFNNSVIKSNIIKKFMTLFDKTDYEKIEKFIEEYDGFNAIPFYHIKSENIEYLPYELLLSAVGSNGMCAGNSPEEALIQGLCEIFERYVLKEIYFNPKRRFPDVPESLFENAFQWKYLLFLKEHGYEVFIKDCSLGGVIPVLAITVKQNDRALLSLGAAPDYRIAFERCVTELFQGTNLEKLDKKLQPIERWCTQSSNWFSDCKKELQYHYMRSLTGTRGSVPLTFFENNNIEFDDKNLFQSETMITKDVLNKLLKICRKQNWDVYIRDISFFNFPSYWIFIPGLSEVNKIEYKNLIFDLDILPKLRKVFFNYKNASIEEIEFLGQTIIEMLDNPRFEPQKIIQILQRLQFNIPINLEHISPEIVLVFIYCRLEKFEFAHEILKKYLEKRKTSTTSLNFSKVTINYQCLLEYLALLSNGYTLLNAKKTLSLNYNPKFVDDIYSIICNPTDLFNYLDFPICDSCNDCKFSNNCCYVKTNELLNNIEIKITPLDQLKIKQFIQI